MSRSIWKGPTVLPNISRASTILPGHIGKTYYIHNGKNYNNVIVTKHHVGLKFGEFVATTIPAIYKKK